jgi:polyprenyl-phospho-N-acetylgalactosaminyl synthase
MPAIRKIILWISKIVTFVFYGAQVSDPHNGYRIISLSVLRKFNLISDGMHYANEVNEQIKKHKMKYEEVPVHIRYTDYSLGK